MIKNLNNTQSPETGKRLWVTWNDQRRNETLSKELGAKLVEYRFSGTNLIRYPFLSLKTLRLLYQTRPDLLFAQNPSLFLTGLVSLVGKLFGFPVVIDAHNAGIYPLEGRSSILNYIALKINSMADVVLVSNDNLKGYLGRNGVDSYSIPDPIPVIASDCSSEVDKAKFNVVYVCSWSGDEPYMDVIKAASLLDDSYKIYVTGKVGSKLDKVDRNDIGQNVAFTGFLSVKDYESLLNSCDAVMVLTTRDDCLVCGAYEGVSVNRPLILSDTAALREYFNVGAVYTENTSAQIASSIIKAKENIERLCEEIITLKISRTRELNEKLYSLNDYLCDLVEKSGN